MKDMLAFPRPHSGATQYAQEGMTLRDYFAAKALQGMIAENGVGALANGDLAKWCYVIADEMMEARTT